MKKLIRVLLVTTIVLAGTTVYYGQALLRERATSGAAAALMPASNAAAASPDRTAGSAPGRSPATMPSADTAANPTRSRGFRCPDPDLLAAARRQLQRFNDPQEHPALKVETRASLSRTWTPIAAAMELPATELDHLLDQMIEGTMRLDQRRTECSADPDCVCNSQAVNASLVEERRQLLTTVLGPVWMPRYEAYTYALPERVFLRIVRGSVEKDHPLAEPEAERLVMAMAGVRRSFIEQQMAQGLRVRIESGGHIVQQIADDQPVRTRWDLTAQYSQQIDLILARHLNAAQMAAFQRQRKERLDNARYVEQLLR